MRFSLAAIALGTVVTLGGVCPPCAHAALVYREGEGWSTEGPDGEQASPSANAQLQKARDLEAQGNTEAAADAFATLVKKFPDAIYVAKAQLKLAQLREADRDLELAFKEYGTYIKKYPRGEGFAEAVEGQFRIAKAFLEGERRKLFGVKTFASMSRTQEMFEEIVKNAPYSNVAPQAQFNIGQALEKQSNRPAALAAYQQVLVNYPGDPIAADAQYQIGYVWFQQTQDGSNDPQARARAREAFEDFIARYPASEKVPQAQDNLKQLSTARTGNTMQIAEFYDKQKNYKAAVIYYNDVIKQQPGSPESDKAKARIDELVNLVGEDTLRAGPEKAETGERAQARRRLQAQVDTAARADYVGPPVVVPDVTPPPKPRLRTSPEDVAPIPAVEPALPTN